MKKKILLSILTVLLMITLLFTLTACGDKDDEEKEDKESSSAQAQVVEDYFENLSNLKFDKAFKLIDWAGYVMVTQEDYDYDEVEEEYDDFCDEYKEELKMMESMVDSMSEYADDYKDYEKFSMEVKNTEKAKKVSGTKNIYTVDADVKVTIQEDEDDDKETENYDLTVYVMKKDGDYYIIDGIDEIMNEL